MYIYLFVLVLATLWDVNTGKVPNKLFVFGVIICQAYLLMQGSVEAASLALIYGILIMLVMFPIFAIGGIGAGDIKLMMLLPTCFSIKESVKVIFLSMILGAVIGIVRLMVFRISKDCIIRVIEYFLKIIHQKEILIYNQMSEIKSGCLGKNQIHFTIPLLVSVVIWIGGINKI